MGMGSICDHDIDEEVGVNCAVNVRHITRFSYQHSTNNTCAPNKYLSLIFSEFVELDAFCKDQTCHIDHEAPSFAIIINLSIVSLPIFGMKVEEFGIFPRRVENFVHTDVGKGCLR